MLLLMVPPTALHRCFSLNPGCRRNIGNDSTVLQAAVIASAYWELTVTPLQKGLTKSRRLCHPRVWHRRNILRLPPQRAMWPIEIM